MNEKRIEINKGIKKERYGKKEEDNCERRKRDRSKKTSERKNDSVNKNRE